MKRVRLEGWFDVRHSFAVVLRNLARHWLETAPAELSFRSMPYVTAWQPTIGPDDPVLDAARRRPGDAAADVVLRMSYPFDASRPEDGARLVLFLSAEGQVLSDEHFASRRRDDLVEGARAGWLAPMVASAWCAEALRGAGIERFHVVPHGVDTALHANATACRGSLGVPAGAFVILSVGAMTPNKGIDRLIRAFHFVRRDQPHLVLLLKGLRPLYPSAELIDRAVRRLVENRRLEPAEAESLRRAILVVDRDLDDAGMASLYASADAYAAPYGNEGFCIPALEAMAVGLPVLASAGGPTDDFLPHDADAAIRVRTTLLRGADGNARLVVDEQSLIDGLRRLVVDGDLRTRAREQGPARAAAYDWSRIAARTFGVLMEHA